MNITSNHPSYDNRTVGRAVRWAARQIGLPPAVLKTLQIEVGFRRSRSGTGWGGWYHHVGRRVQVLLPRSQDKVYPTGIGWNGAEEGRQALDELELFVSILSHELEHARCFAVARTYRQQRELNREDRVRAVDWRATLAFRQDRDAILASWGKTREKPDRSADLLAKWERKLKLAKTKVAKYRRLVKRRQACPTT